MLLVFRGRVVVVLRDGWQDTYETAGMKLGGHSDWRVPRLSTMLTNVELMCARVIA